MGHPVEIVQGALDRVLRLVQLGGSHQGRGAGKPPPPGPRGDGPHHVQIPQDLGPGRRRWWIGLVLPVGLQKQPRVVENPSPDRRRAVAPCGIQLPGFAGAEPVRRERFSHPIAVLEARPRHRHQKLRRHMRGDVPVAHLLLDRFRKKLHQGQPARYPAHAPVEPARHLIQAVAELLPQLRQQPALFQRGVLFGKTHRAVQHQGLGFGHRPHGRFHRIPAQLPQAATRL